MTPIDSGLPTALAQAFERAVDAPRAGRTLTAIAGCAAVQALWPSTRGGAQTLGLWRHR